MQQFLVLRFGHSRFSNYQVWGLVSLVDHTKAIVKDGKPKSDALFNALGEKGIETFRKIFENNNERLHYQFFENDLIKQLWPLFAKDCTEA